MADFSVSATQLPDAQGAGSSPLRAIEPLPKGPNLGAELGNSILDIFAKGIIQSKKEEAAKLKQAVIAGFVQQETAINDAVVSGQMNPAQAASRSRANFNKYASSYSEFIKDFEEAGKALRGFTETGQVQEALASEKELRKKALDQAVSRGYQTYEGMGKSAEDAIIKASQTGIRAERETQQFYQAQNERRSQADFDTRQAEAEAKRFSVKLINDIAGDNLSAFQALGSDLGNKVRNGTMEPARAQALLGERFNNISAAIQSAAGVHPELAQGYRSLFNEANTLAQKWLDPKTNADDLENQYKSLVNRLKIVAMGNPSDAAVIVGSQLLPNSPQMLLTSSLRVPSIMARLGNVPAGSKQFVPQVVGDPEVESDILTSLKEVLPKLKGNLIGDKEIATLQASNSVNNILTQVGKAIDSGLDAKGLKGLADFFSSPQYGDFVKSGKIDAQAQAAAYKTFQLNFEPTIIKGVQQKLDEYLYSQAVFTRGGKSVDPKKLKDVVDVKFVGSGINFLTKDVKGLDPVEMRSQVQAVEELKTAQKAINQLIHMGTHFEGSTDYAKFWEAHKHEFLPSMFAPPKKTETPPEVKIPANLSAVDRKLAENFSAPDSSKNLTAGVLAATLEDLKNGKLNEEQKKELRKILEQIKE